jgi:hypothetical protein
MAPNDPEVWARAEGIPPGYQRIDTKAKPTQTVHPWRATTRTVFAAVLALLPLLPVIVGEFGIAAVPWVAAGLSAIGAVTRTLAIPAVNSWITEYVPWLAPTPRQP